MGERVYATVPRTLDDFLAIGIRTAAGCLEWPRARFATGYGAIGISDHVLRVHRVVYELAYGPTRFHVLHKCDNPPCLEPTHLFAGTPLTNRRDASQKGRLGGDHKPADQVARAVALVATGLTIEEAAHRLGRHYNTVHRWLRAEGVPMRKPGRPFGTSRTAIPASAAA
jgi:excisionase family DNA binding protein